MNSVIEEPAKDTLLTNGNTSGLPPPPPLHQQPQHQQIYPNAQKHLLVVNKNGPQLPLPPLPMPPGVPPPQQQQQQQPPGPGGNGTRPPSIHFRASQNALIAPQPS